MRTIKLSDGNVDIKTCVATIGFFDGVHRGHQFLIQHVIDEAKAAGLESTVVTFDAHPRQVLHSDFVPKLLSTLDMKLIQLAKTNVDNCVLLHFDEEMARLSAHDFMEKILRDRLHVQKLVIGYDNRFGHDRKESFNDYVRYGKELGMEVIQNQALMVNGINVSSSVIRSYVQAGEIEMANQCLGYPYTIMGTVVQGFHEGRKLGFPTANLDNKEFGQLIPAPGVYAVKARLKNSMEMKRAMMNIGTRPTFDGKDLTLETHIFNFHQDIYGEMLLVSFMHRIREEHKFDHPDDLVQQLQKDERLVEEQFDKELDL